MLRINDQNDLTLEEREEGFKLRQEMRERKEKGEDVCIFRGKIIPVRDHPKNKNWLKTRFEKQKDTNKNNNSKNDIDINKNNSSKINLECTQNFEKSKQNSFKIMYSNVDTLSNKLNEVEYYSEIYETDLILITEHLPKNSLDKFENVFNIPGFSCIEDCSGRGVCIFYKDDIEIVNHKYINELYHPSLFFNIKTTEKSLNIGLVYRSPNNDPLENKKLNNQLNFASKKLKNLIVFGDFNHPHID